jgi:alpha-L-fucosidase
VNTFHVCVWSDGSLPVATFPPGGIDAAGWADAACAAGLGMVVLVAKHIDGFALWPTAHSPYSVAASPCPVDVVAAAAAACRARGLGFGLYYALWDRRHDTGDDAAYAAFVRAQVTELATRYGALAELWFDGAWEKIHPTASGNRDESWKTWDEARFRTAWERTARRRWEWDRLVDLIRAHQPGCVVLNNTTTHFPGVPWGPVDARTGEKAERLATDREIWDQDGTPVRLPLQIETTLSRQGPPGPFADGSWFWHAWDRSCASVDEVRAWRAAARARGAVLLLNAGPGPDGRLRPEDDRLLRALGPR